MTTPQNPPAAQENSEPLGIKNPLLPHQPLPGLQFIVPSGAKSISVLDPSIFSTNDTLQRAELHQPFDELPFFQPSDLNSLAKPLSASASAVEPPPTTPPTVENISAAAKPSFQPLQPSPDIPLSASTASAPNDATIQRTAEDIAAATEPRFQSLQPSSVPTSTASASAPADSSIQRKSDIVPDTPISEEPISATPISQIQRQADTPKLDDFTPTIAQRHFAPEAIAPQPSDIAPSFTESPPRQEVIQAEQPRLDESASVQEVAPVTQELQSPQGPTPPLAPKPSVTSDVDSSVLQREIELSPSELPASEPPSIQKKAAQPEDVTSLQSEVAENESAPFTPNPEISAATPSFTQQVSPTVESTTLSGSDTPTPMPSEQATPDLQQAAESAANDTGDTSGGFVQEDVNSTVSEPASDSNVVNTPTNMPTEATDIQRSITSEAALSGQEQTSEPAQEESPLNRQQLTTPETPTSETPDLEPLPSTNSPSLTAEPSFSDTHNPENQNTVETEAPSLIQRQMSDSIPAQDVVSDQGTAPEALIADKSPAQPEFSSIGSEAVSPTATPIEQRLDSLPSDHDVAGTQDVPAQASESSISEDADVEVQNISAPENAPSIQTKASSDSDSQISTTDLTSDFQPAQDIHEASLVRPAPESEQSSLSETSVFEENDGSAQKAAVPEATPTIQRQVLPDSVSQRDDSITQSSVLETSAADSFSSEISEAQLWDEENSSLQSDDTASTGEQTIPVQQQETQPEPSPSSADDSIYQSAIESEVSAPIQRKVSSDSITQQTGPMAQASASEPTNPSTEIPAANTLFSETDPQSVEQILPQTDSVSSPDISTPDTADVPSESLFPETNPPAAQRLSTPDSETSVQRQILPELSESLLSESESPAAQKLSTPGSETQLQRQALPETSSEISTAQIHPSVTSELSGEPPQSANLSTDSLSPPVQSAEQPDTLARIIQQTDTAAPDTLQRQTAHPNQPPTEWSSVEDLLSQLSTPSVAESSSSDSVGLRDSTQPTSPVSSAPPAPSTPPTPSQQQAYPDLHPFDPGPQTIQAKHQDAVTQASIPPDLQAFAANDETEVPAINEAAEEESGEGGSASPDQLEQLAQAVYQSVKQRLMIERERSGYSYSGRLF